MRQELQLMSYRQAPRITRWSWPSLFLAAALAGCGKSSTGDEVGPEVVFDLVAELPRAEVRRSSPDVVFGSPLGRTCYAEADLRHHHRTRGWYSARDARSQRAFAYLLGEGSFDLPLYGEGEARFELQGAIPDVPPASGHLTLNVNGQDVGDLVLPKGIEPGTASLEIPQALFVQGVNRFSLRGEPVLSVDVGLPFRVVTSAMLLVATLHGRVRGPRGEPFLEERLPQDSALSQQVIVEPAGSEMRFYLEVGPGERLEVGMLATGSVSESLRATILIEPEGGAARVLERLDLAPLDVPERRTVDLGAFAGSVCALTLRAGDLAHPAPNAFIEWWAPRIVREASAPPPEPSPPRRPSPAPTRARPDIIVLLLDAARASHVTCYGGRAGVTPEIDKLAAGAIRFTRALAPAPYTLPSVGSLFTSLPADRHGVTASVSATRSLALDPELPTLASSLQQAGYATAAIVTNPNAAALYGYGKGFAQYDELFRDPSLWNEGVAPEPTVEAALARLDSLTTPKERSPFFLYVHFFPPHAPYTAPETFKERFMRPYEGPADGTIQLITGFADTGEPPLDERDFEHLAELYDARLAHTDAEVGRLLGALKERGLYDNSLIVVCADHGEAFGEHSSLGHGHHLYEPALHVPLIVKLPGGRRAGETAGGTVSLLDLAPTLLRAAGLEKPPATMEGLDLVDGASRAALKRRLLLARSDVFAPSFSLACGSVKYIYDSLSRRQEMYDLAADPTEEHDIVSERAIRAGFMRALLCRELCRVLADRNTIAVVPAPTIVDQLEQIGYVAGSAPGASSVQCPLLRR
ncbi:MAG: sulfatase [Planctomycetota bacterium]